MANQLNLEKRTTTGKKLKAVRATGKIPSVIYGADQPILAVSEYIATEKVLQAAGYHSPVELLLDGDKQLAIVKHVDLNPVNRRIINIEFQAVSADAEVEATTPLKLENFEASEASKKHLALLQVVEDVEVKAKPSALPSELILDASHLATTEDKLTYADIKLPRGVNFADKELELDAVVANVYDPAAEAAAREAEDAAAAEAEAAAGEASDQKSAETADEEKAE